MGAQRDKVASVCARQAGRIHHRQLIAAGLSARQIASWLASGRLIRTRGKVFALGYVRRDRPAQLWEAVLYAGPGACLTAATGAYHCGLITRWPQIVTVCTPKRCPSVRDLHILDRRDVVRRVVDGLPVARLENLMLDLATESDFTELRFALANLEFRRQLDIARLHDACGRGRPGSRQLRRALAHRLPQLARTKSRNEIAFLLLLEAHHLPLPLVNVRLHGIEVDAYFPALGLVVEIDSEANHGTAAQRRTDAARTAMLRAHGLAVIRLSDIDIDILHRGPETVATLAGYGVSRTP